MLRHPAPRLGEHTQELLDEYGFSQDEIGALLWSYLCAGRGGGSQPKQPLDQGVRLPAGRLCNCSSSARGRRGSGCVARRGDLHDALGPESDYGNATTPSIRACGHRTRLYRHPSRLRQAHGHARAAYAVLGLYSLPSLRAAWRRPRAWLRSRSGSRASTPRTKTLALRQRTRAPRANQPSW